MPVFKSCLFVGGLLMCGVLFGLRDAHAQSPEGPQLPAPDAQTGKVHGEVRLGQYLVTHTFRYQGEYEAETNLFRVGPSPLYIFGDVDVEAVDDSSHGKFNPQRLVGTFEVGLRDLFGVKPLSVLVRHESAHYTDLNNLYQGSWDMVGARWQQTLGRSIVTGTLAKYSVVHQLAANYTVDADLQDETTFGSVHHHRLFVRADLHEATANGGRGGFLDYWLEPSVVLGAQSVAFIGYGQIHDTNFSAANVDHPVMLGVRLLY